MSDSQNLTSIINNLKEATKKNFQSLLDKGSIYAEDKIQKNYIQNYPIDYSLNSTKKPIPINIIYHSLYDQDNLCQSSNGKLNFQRHNFSIRKDYDINYDKKTFDNNETPKYFKIPIKDCVKSFIENKSIKDEIDDLDNYPKIFEFQYKYQHPIPNPVLFGPKLLENTDNYKIIFISPICLIIEQKNECTGFSGIDCFYSAMRFKFDMELNDDLTIKRTLFNCYFGVNFIKSNWLQGKITSSAYKQAEEGFNNKFLPSISKELNLTIKKYSNNGGNTPQKKIDLDDLIENDFSISDSEDEKEEKKKRIKIENIKKNIKYLIYFILIIIVIIIALYFVRFITKDYILIILLGVIAFYLVMINSKLDKLGKEKNI